MQQFGSAVCCLLAYSESSSSCCAETFTGDDVDGEGVGVFLLVDANKEAAWASICCFGKSCDGHSKCTQWKIYEQKLRMKINNTNVRNILNWN